MLTGFIPTSKRKKIYFWFAMASLALGAIQVGFGAAEVGQPTWLNVALAVFSFVSSGVGFVAHGNSTEPPSESDGPEVYGE